MPEQLADIIAAMVHSGVNARRNLARGLIISYRAPDPDSPPGTPYTLSTARNGQWPDDRELAIVRNYLERAFARHPVAVAYNVSQWQKREQRLQQGGTLGIYAITWQQWPIKRMFDAPPELLPALKTALANR